MNGLAQRLFGFGALLALGCERPEPPGGEPAETVRAEIGSSQAQPTRAPEGAKKGDVLGTIDDHLPFEPDGTRLASIAWRTWIYTDTGAQRTRLGYLRAGAIVDARGPAIVNSGCEGGWYRINPRGFVCIGKGATLDLDQPLIAQSSRRPTRGEGFPYLYAMSDEPPPHRYFRLPTPAQMREVEGPSVADRALAFLLRARESGLAERLGGLAEPPSFLTPTTVLEKPYGTKSPLRTRGAAGQAARGSGFALAHTFTWSDRAFGLGTELDVLPLDRLVLKPAQALEGVHIPEGHAPEVAFHVKGTLTLWKKTENGFFVPAGEQREKRAFLLTGQQGKGGMLETEDGPWIAKESVRLLSVRDGFPSVAHGSRKWIDVSIKDQTLVAYVGQNAVFATLVSTGRGEMGDPERDQATVRGTFMIYEKSVSSTMDGDQDRADSYELTDVPFVQYFHKGFALHGAYWHDDFGKARSHGCVNLSAKDSAWLFEWTDPPVPPDWHAVLNKERGTVVYVRR
jgi:lipoprotein-anchoring transpeptidase ErfK/SrfK